MNNPMICNKLLHILAGIILMSASHAEPLYKVGDKALGGTILLSNKAETHGYVVANQDQEQGSEAFDSDDKCKNPNLFDEAGQEYDDWQLPPLFVLMIMYEKQEEIGGFNHNKHYWSGTPLYEFAYRIKIDFSTGKTGDNKIWRGNVRCVRRF